MGDIPLELQPKLLRVLQEQEFERLGSSRTLRVNVRLVAATSRNLLEMVDKHEFRGDLYYRLNVFPITIPPLRERREDIPLLARYFAEKYSRRMNKRIETIPADVMQALQQYQWPGNIRELQNFIERAVILIEDNHSSGAVGRIGTACGSRFHPSCAYPCGDRPRADHPGPERGERRFGRAGRRGGTPRAEAHHPPLPDEAAGNQEIG